MGPGLRGEWTLKAFRVPARRGPRRVVRGAAWARSATPTSSGWSRNVERSSSSDTSRARVWRPSADANRTDRWRDASETLLKIDALMVTATARRDGVGTALMEAAEAWGNTHDERRSP